MTRFSKSIQILVAVAGLSSTGCSQPIGDPVLSFRYERIEIPATIAGFEDLEIRIRRSGLPGQEEVDFIDLKRGKDELRIGAVNPPYYQFASISNGKLTHELTECRVVEAIFDQRDRPKVGSPLRWIDPATLRKNGAYVREQDLRELSSP